MRLATWNVNSLRVRLPAVERWIEEYQPDVLLLQETKLADGEFPAMPFAALGYESAHHGDGRWNGVAIVSRIGLEEPRAGFHDAAPGDVEECRIITAKCGPLQVFSVYVPNGRSVDSEFYVAKLGWLERLRGELEATSDPGADVVVGGDFNVAPSDLDVWDPAQFVGATHVTEAERAALRRVTDWGLVDALRQVTPEGPGPFSWWDYRGGAFHRGQGMRIDLLLLNTPLAARLEAVSIDREARKIQAETKPSDHAPVMADIH
jgi:exodeoxyribonuclease-3